jgi:hypothetical protein
MSDDDSKPANGPPGAEATFPYDRETVEQFRRRFPRARWSDIRQSWFVPGRTASRRIGRWLAEKEAEAEAFADEKGRDAFEFNPIDSPYLERGKGGFRIRTPYSKTVVDELREVPYARWDGELRIWHVPFRSYEELRRRWPEIEAAARRNEPEERRRRAEERKGTEEERWRRLRSAERRRRRYPLRHSDLPPLGRPVATEAGIVVFTEVTGELVEVESVFDFYPHATDEHVWVRWRKPTFQELVHSWPAKVPRFEGAEWWVPTIEELRPARRAARSRELRKLAGTVR